MKKLYPSFVFICIIMLFGVMHCWGAQDTSKASLFLISMRITPQTITHSQPVTLTAVSPDTLSGSYNVTAQLVQLAWTDENSSTTDYYEIQRSEAGVGFTTRALFFPDQQTAREGFAYKDKYAVKDAVLYRLKIISTSKTVRYTNIVKVVR